MSGPICFSRRAAATLFGIVALSVIAAPSGTLHPLNKGQAPVRIDLDRLAKFESDLERLRAQLRIPGISAAIVQEGTVAWAKGFGLADVESARPAEPETPYPLASVTKVFASTLLMRLVESGHLHLDDPMSRYSPDFGGDRIRVKHVLSHTSDGVPGEKFLYNSDRYGLLSQVVTRLTGFPFRLFLARTILDPLGMASTVPGAEFEEAEARGDFKLDEATRERYRRVAASMAKPYRLYGADEVVRAPYPAFDLDAAAGIVSTVLDLAEFDAAIDSHRLLAPETQERAWRPFASNGGSPLPYGLGWFVEDFSGVRLIWHYGYFSDSFSSLYLKVPARSLTLILLANSDALSSPFDWEDGRVEASALACSFLKRLVFHDQGKVLEREAEARVAIGRWLEDKRASYRRAVPVDDKDLAPCAGRYQLRPKGVLTVTFERGALWIDMPQDLKSQLFPMGRNRFFLKSMDMEMAFKRDRRGIATAVKFSANGATVWATKIPGGSSTSTRRPRMSKAL